MKIPSSVAKAALDLSALNTLFGEETTAGQVLETALARHRREVISQVADKAAQYAEQAEREMDPGVSAAAVLGWFADELRKELPDEDLPGAYTPVDGDVVELAVTGQINEYRTRLPSGRTTVTWEVATDRGLTLPLENYDFHEMRVQRLLRANESEQEEK